ncbi:DUF6508 domain-containing protein [uncultured Sphingomonas sp.]|uniref:DUF6508 domain-containing protein n=1 Tax=uncultured Sphingomonas sp. TaxID=158754 RepID=UPI0025D6D360|nr:DUF6508 domain-containing protein [uncultured Sphingomonas sp.]
MDQRTLRNIAAFAPLLAAPDFVAGEWAEVTRSPEGVLSLPWFRLSETASAFVAAISTEDLAEDYLAVKNQEERASLMRLAQDSAAMAGASVEQLGWVLMYQLRSERFVEGSLAQAFDTSLMRAIAERAAVLAASDPT